MKFPTVEEMARNVAENALDEWEYRGKTLRQWVEIILATDINVATKDAISRRKLQEKFEQWQKTDGYSNGEWNLLVDVLDVIKSMPPVSQLGTNLAEVGTDCISRQEAISAICNACGKMDCDKMDKCEKLQLSLANISETPNSSDTISRRQAIDAIEAEKIKHGDYLTSSYVGYEMAEKVVKQLPPIQPKRIRGQWSIKGQAIDTVRGYWAKCSACGHAVFGGGNYCSNCGSYNKGEVIT